MKIISVIVLGVLMALSIALSSQATTPTVDQFICQSNASQEDIMVYYSPNTSYYSYPVNGGCTQVANFYNVRVHVYGESYRMIKGGAKSWGKCNNGPYSASNPPDTWKIVWYKTYAKNNCRS